MSTNPSLLRYGVMDVAPSEGRVHPPDAVITMALVMAPRERLLIEAMERGCARVGHDGFAWNYWRAPKKRRVYGKRVLAALLPELADGNCMLYLFSVRYQRMMANAHAMLMALDLHRDLYELTDEQGVRWMTGFDLPAQRGHRGISRLKWHIAVPIVWMAFTLFTNHTGLCQHRIGKGKRPLRWNIVTDQIAGEKPGTCFHGAFLRLILDHATRRHPFLENLFYTNDGDTLPDKIADTMAGFATEALSSQDADWIDMRRQLHASKGVLWIGYEDRETQTPPVLAGGAAG